MSKSYLSGAAMRSAREERGKKVAKLPRMSAFLKPADSAPSPMITESESNPAFISAVVSVAMEMGTGQNRASENTTLLLHFNAENF